MKESIWLTLSQIDCSKFTEQKNGLTYLSWAHAWAKVKENYPKANYRIVSFEGKPYLFDENLGYLVQTEVEIEGEKIGMQLPVMDGANKAQKHILYQYETKFGEKSVQPATMFDINTAIMRCLTKNLAMFGLGHYIYAGEDLPPNQAEENKEVKPAETPKPVETPKSSVELDQLKKLASTPELVNWVEKKFGKLEQIKKPQAIQAILEIRQAKEKKIK